MAAEGKITFSVDSGVVINCPTDCPRIDTCDRRETIAYQEALTMAGNALDSPIYREREGGVSFVRNGERLPVPSITVEGDGKPGIPLRPATIICRMTATFDQGIENLVA